MNVTIIKDLESSWSSSKITFLVINSHHPTQNILALEFLWSCKLNNYHARWLLLTDKQIATTTMIFKFNENERWTYIRAE